MVQMDCMLDIEVTKGIAGGRNSTRRKAETCLSQKLKTEKQNQCERKQNDYAICIYRVHQIPGNEQLDNCGYGKEAGGQGVKSEICPDWVIDKICGVRIVAMRN